MTPLILAVQFLTRLPMPRVAAKDRDLAASMRWFPVVGLVVGALVAAAGAAGALLDPWTGALAALVAWVGVTGALHLDGLGDLADAAGAAHGDRSRLLAVLADPHVGSFGVAAIVLQLVAKLILLHHTIADERIAPLVLVPFAARIGPILWTLWLPSLHDGLAARFRSGVAPVHLAIWSATLLISAWFVPAMLVAIPAALAYGTWLRRRIGGISGDGHGGGIELVETALLLGLAAVGDR